MKTMSLGFIGGGRITKIMLQAFKRKSIVFNKIVVFDTSSETTGKLKAMFPQIEISGIEQCSAQDVVLIALHPPVIMETLEKAAPFISDKTIVLSLAPKIKMEGISARLKTKRIVRLIPNATSVINEGYNPVCFSGGESAAEKSAIMELLGVLGKTFEVPEHKLEAYAVLSAMAPTYFWFQWKTLSEIGVKIGMTDEEARSALYNTLLAALNTYFKSGMTPEAVFDLVPVKPMAEYESQISELFHSKLSAVFEKIKP